MLLQIIITILVIIAISVIVNKKIQNKLSLGQGLTWLVMWLIVLVVFWYPETASYLANALNIGRGADLIIYAAIVVMFYMIFRMYMKVDKIKTDITKVVRRVGLDEADKKDNSEL